MVDLGIEEMRKNPWLIDHALESLTKIPYIADKYGQKNIDACKEWLANNRINVYMRPRNDKDELPCITIYPGQTPEKDGMKHMGDASTESVILKPQEIGKPINYIVKPFTPEGYDPITGEVFVNNSIKGMDSVVKGQILVDPSTGVGHVIKEVLGDALVIEEGLSITASQFAVVPEFQFYKARIEHTFFMDSYNIGCHAHGDVQTLIWLHTIVLYAILRYRESLLEGNGFAESSVSNGEILEDPAYEGPNGEQAYARFITITGQVENTWIKSPRRFIENVALKDGNTGGIKVLSNLDAPPIVNKEDENWFTVEDDVDDEEET